MAVKDILPEDRGSSRADHFDLALTALRDALWTQQIGEAGDAGATKAMVIHAQIALAEVRAWRKSLPEEGVRQDDKARSPFGEGTAACGRPWGLMGGRMGPATLRRPIPQFQPPHRRGRPADPDQTAPGGGAMNRPVALWESACTCPRKEVANTRFEGVNMGPSIVRTSTTEGCPIHDTCQGYTKAVRAARPEWSNPWCPIHATRDCPEAKP